MLSVVLERQKEDEENETYIREYVEHVWTTLSNKLSSNWLESIQAPLAADVAMIKLGRIVAIATTNHDGQIKGDEPLEKHTPDNEPVPVSMDPWARGAVATRKNKGAASEFAEDFDVLERTPSINSSASFQSFSSFRSSNSKSSSKMGAPTIRTRVRTGASAIDSEAPREGQRGGTGEIIDLDEDQDNDNSNLNATGHLFDMLQKSVCGLHFRYYSSYICINIVATEGECEEQGSQCEQGGP